MEPSDEEGAPSSDQEGLFVAMTFHTVPGPTEQAVAPPGTEEVSKQVLLKVRTVAMQASNPPKVATNDHEILVQDGRTARIDVPAETLT